MVTQTKAKALCFFEQDFAQKHNAFFSLKQTAKQSAEQQNFLSVPTNLGFDVYVFETITSTLDKAHELSEISKMHPFTTLVCQKQTCGRGQLRRKWESLENNLYTAIFLPDVYPFNTEAAAPAFGGVVAYALEKMGFSVELKWPNDIVQKGDNGYEKVGGILLEQRNNALVAGMGINLFSAPQNELLRDNFFISAGQLKDFAANARQKEFLNYFNNSLLQTEWKKTGNNSQSIDNTEEIDKFFVNLGFCFALVKEINLWYKKNLLSIMDTVGTNTVCENIAYKTTAWSTLCKKYLAFLGDTVCVREALIKEAPDRDTIYSGDIIGQIVGLGEEGELILSSKNGLIYIVGGSITK